MRTAQPMYMAKTRAKAAPATLTATLERDAAPVKVLGLVAVAVTLVSGILVGATVARVVDITPGTCAGTVAGAAGVVAAGIAVPGTRPTPVAVPGKVWKTTCGTVTALEMTCVVEAGPLERVQGTTTVV